MKLTRWIQGLLGIALLVVPSAGCVTLPSPHEQLLSPLPRELAKVSLPTYVIEPPDILLIDAVRLVPLPPYRIEPLDSLLIQATGTPADEPIAGIFVVEPEGTVNLGISYGQVTVVGMTIEEAKSTVEKHLERILKTTRVLVSLAQSRGQQQVRGEHLVRPDGTVGLGTYGSVAVAGMTLDEAKAAIERQLAKFVLKPEISIDVLAYNSKVYYVIFDGGGAGQQMVRLPITGNDTVLDAIAQVNGLPVISSKHHIWIARPAPPELGCYQILPVDWNAMTMGGQAATNYQLLPGDRIYVKADFWITFDTVVGKMTAPFERLFGFTLLGNSVVRTLQSKEGGVSGGGGGF